MNRFVDRWGTIPSSSSSSSSTGRERFVFMLYSDTPRNGPTSYITSQTRSRHASSPQSHEQSPPHAIPFWLRSVGSDRTGVPDAHAPHPPY